MNIPSRDDLTHRRNTKNDDRHAGFSLLEMMMVIAVILIIASISTPFYKTAIIRAREAVLREQVAQTCFSRSAAFSLRSRQHPF